MKFITLGVEFSTGFVNVCFAIEVICMFVCYQCSLNSFKLDCLSFLKTQQSFDAIDFICAHCCQSQLKSWPKSCSFLFAWQVQICKGYIQVSKIYDHLLAPFLSWTHSPSQSKWWLTEAKFTLFMSLHSCAGIATSVRTEKKITLELP